VRLLVVKTTSMGDVVHAMPALTDMLRAMPALQVDWLVEQPFAAIPALHPGVQRVLPLSWRKWRQQLTKGKTWSAMRSLRAQLREQPYDLILDLQGLLKSALWARQAIGPVAGFDSASAREPAACWWYQRKAAVPRTCTRWTAAAAWPRPTWAMRCRARRPTSGLQAPPPTWGAPDRYSVLIPNASRAEKLWPESRWVAVGKRLHDRGWKPVVLWGSPVEQTLAERIAAGCDGDVPPFLKVRDMAAVLAGAQTVVGLDTGFTHLAAALGRPTIGIYCDHEPGLAGVMGPGSVHSLGGKGQVPKLPDVLALLESQHGTAPLPR
jgi:heptosyltransferase-1